MSAKVIVAIYTHRHGTDVRVFATSEGANVWRNDLADEWWERELGTGLPTDKTPDEIAAAYWSAMESRDEFFETEEHEVVS